MRSPSQITDEEVLGENQYKEMQNNFDDEEIKREHSSLQLYIYPLQPLSMRHNLLLCSLKIWKIVSASFEAAWPTFRCQNLHLASKGHSDPLVLRASQKCVPMSEADEDSQGKIGAAEMTSFKLAGSSMRRLPCDEPLVGKMLWFQCKQAIQGCQPQTKSWESFWRPEPTSTS